MGTGVKNKYHVAINGSGYILRGAPAKPAYSRSVVPSQVERLAISDLAYSDFAGTGLFYLAQTDWSAGIKSEKVWRDDAKFYYSTNIDTYSEPGSIKLPLDVAQETGFSNSVVCAVYGEAERVSAAIASEYFGGDAGGGALSPDLMYKTSETANWTSLASLNSSNRSLVSQVLTHKNKIFFNSCPIGTNTTEVIKNYYQGSVTDHTGAVSAAIAWASAPTASRAMCIIAGTIYAGVDRISSNFCGVVKSADGGTTWSSVFEINGKHFIADMIGYGDGIYYLLDTNDGSGGLELRFYDLVNSADALIKRFPYGYAWRKWTTGSGTEYTTARGTGGRYLFVFNGKLVVTAPQKSGYGEIWDYDETTLRRIFVVDETKEAIGGDATSYIDNGGCEHKNRLHWGNLVYDGEYFFNGVKNFNDTTDQMTVPIFSNGNLLYYSGAKGQQMASIMRENSGVYRSVVDKNYLVFSEMAPVASIDKLFYSLTVIFDVLDVAELIKIEYSIDDRVTWTNIGTVTPASEGSGTKREFVIPNNVIYNKIWFRVNLNGDGTSTPKLNDLIIAYKPMPNYKNRWVMRLAMSDEVKLLNNQIDERRGYEMSSELWNEKLIKQSVLFEDVDYMECNLVSAMASGATSALVDKTNRFPRQGRVRAVSGGVAEEMYYTSATPNKILGITRGARGTRARAYVSGKLKNDYDVYVEDIKTELNFTDEKKNESIAQVMLIEL